MIADEISEQEIHGLPYEVTGADAAKKRGFLRRKYGRETKTLDLDASITVATQGDLIDKGVKDKDILAELRKTRGLMCLKPHLLR